MDAEFQSTETSIAKTDLETSMDDSQRYNLTFPFCVLNADHVVIP